MFYLEIVEQRYRAPTDFSRQRCDERLRENKFVLNKK